MYLKYKATEALLEAKDGIVVPNIGFKVRNMYRNRVEFKLLGLVLIGIQLLSIYGFIKSYNEIEFTVCVHFLGYSLIIGTFPFIHMTIVGTVVIVWKLKDAKENFGFRKELRLYMFGSIFGVIAMVSSVLSYHISTEEFIILSMLSFCMFSLFMLKGNLYVVQECKKLNVLPIPILSTAEKYTQYSRVYQFEKVIQDPEAVQVFRKFCEGEWSVENITCFMAIKSVLEDIQMHSGVTKSGMKSLKGIIHDFITYESPMCVNISHKVRERILTSYRNHELEELLNSMNLCMKELYMLMFCDSFSRFISTSQFKELSELQMFSQTTEDDRESKLGIS